jgi:hypothetical protein
MALTLASVGGVVRFMLILLRDVQFAKALAAILVIPVPMVTVSRPVQPENALAPIDVTLFGIKILVISRRPANALAPMLATVPGTTDIFVPTTSSLPVILIILFPSNL